MHLLVTRFSAIGDVALIIPVIGSFQQQYPDVKVSVVSRPMFRSLFEPLSVNFISAEFNGSHKGLIGLRRLYQDIISEVKPDAVIDLHSVLRSHVLTSFFRLSKIPVFKIDKNRKGKRALTRQKNKIRKPLRYTALRYADVFTKAGYNLRFSPVDYPVPDYRSAEADELWENLNLKDPAIGIAPMATYPGKTWPVTKLQELIQKLTAEKINILLFGGPADQEFLEKLQNKEQGIFRISEKLNFAGEVALMRKLSLMVSMDSSNMHLASLAKIPIVSIWGATHKYAGFGPLGENDRLIVEIPTEELTCRPCSVYGNKPCFRKDYACLNWIEADHVMEKVKMAMGGGSRE